MTLPTSGEMTNVSIKHPVMRPLIKQQRDHTSMLPGSSAVSVLNITSGAITIPAVDGGTHTISTESDIVADDLTTVLLTNTWEGQLISLQASDISQVVTVVHGNGGNGQILLKKNKDFILDALDKEIVLRRVGNDWVEHSRNYGTDEVGFYDFHGKDPKLDRTASAFSCHEQSTLNMTVRVDAGAIWDGSDVTEIDAQNTSIITAPTTNPRIDRVVLVIATGAIEVRSGNEAASPQPPSIPSGRRPLCKVSLAPGQSTITNNEITDERLSSTILFGTDQLGSVSDIPNDRKVVQIVRNFGSGQSGVLLANNVLKACGYSNNQGPWAGNPTGNNAYKFRRINFNTNPGVISKYIGGYFQGFAIAADGNVYSWGHNAAGNLGHGDTASKYVATRIEYFFTNSINIVDVICSPNNYHGFGYSCTYFISDTGDVYATGYNGQGNLGLGDAINRTTPEKIPELSGITKLVCSGLPHFCYAIDSNNDLWVWGYNANGQLGMGDTTQRNSPVNHPTQDNVADIKCAAGYTTAGAGGNGWGATLDTSGVIWTVGSNNYGQLGHGNLTQLTSFLNITSPEVFTHIDLFDGYYGSLYALTDTNELRACGYNGQGQLGSGATANQTSLITPAGDFQGSIDSIRIGGNVNYSSTIVKAGNDLFAAGYNGYGQLSLGDAVARNVFTKIIGISGTITDYVINGHNQYTALQVLYDDGHSDACGYNGNGGLGTAQNPIHPEYLLQPQVVL